MKLPFDVKEEALKEIVNNILARAKEIRQGLKTDPVGTVKNYKALLDVHSLTVVKKKKSTKKKSAPPKKSLNKALKKARTTKKKSTTAVH